MTCNFRVAGNKLHPSKKRKKEKHRPGEACNFRHSLYSYVSTMLFLQATNVTVLQSIQLPACKLANAIDSSSSNLWVCTSKIFPQQQRQQHLSHVLGINPSLSFLDDTLGRQRNKHWEEEMHYSDCNLTRWFIDVWKQLWIVFECLFFF